MTGSRTALAALLTLTLAACSQGPPQGDEVTPALDTTGAVLTLLKEPKPVTDFSVTDIQGRTIRSADLRGKVVFVNFWATWCPPCRAEIPDLIQLQNKYRDEIVILGISEDEDGLELVRSFVAEHKMNYPVAMTTPEVAAVFKGISALPTTFVIDREGKIVQRHQGLLNPVTTELEALYLSGKKPDLMVEYVDDPTKVLLQNAAQATSVPGVDLSSFTPAKRTEAIKALNAADCTCGCGLTLAACRINDPECPVSLPAARDLVAKLTQ
jgi:thiol-disulfide isomerase/thioredoxin